MAVIDRSKRKILPRTADDANSIKRVRRQRGKSEEHMEHSLQTQPLPPSSLPDYYWREYERIALKHYGPDEGKMVFKALRVGEFDYEFFGEVFLGVVPLWWQTKAWNEGLQMHRYVSLLLSNAGGKTTDFAGKYFTAGTYHQWAPEWWTSYLMLHMGPLEDHALGCHTKMKEWMRGTAREQQKALPEGGYELRPFLLEPFVREKKMDKGKHEGVAWMSIEGEEMTQLVFLPTAHGATAADGRGPHLIGEDELRYETQLIANVEGVFLPRFIRAPGGRLYLPGTPKGASVEMVALNERAKDQTDPANIDWFGMQINLRDANNTILEEEIVRAERNIGKRLHAQVLGGQAIQPEGAHFSMEATKASFFGTTTPKWLSVLGPYGQPCRCTSCLERKDEIVQILAETDIANVRQRVEARCQKCVARKKGDVEIERQHPSHPMIGALDPASSAAFDAIVCTIWDLEPPGYPDSCWAEVVYIEEIAPGTRVQHVALHASAISRLIGGEVGFDRKSGVGHAVKDQLVELDGDFVELATNTRDAKDEWLDYFGAIIDLGKWRCPHHLPTLSQIINYKRADKTIQTDFLMAQVIAAQTAMPYLPSVVADDPEDSDRNEEEIGYAGLGEIDASAYDLPEHESDPMFSDPPRREVARGRR